MQEERVVRWWHLAMEVQRILTKTIDMCGEVGAQPGQDLFVHGIPFGRELMQDTRLRMHIVEDQAIGDEMTVLDPFPLNHPVIRGNQAFAPKEDPPNEAVEESREMLGVTSKLR